jgi:RNA polymerase sigma factor (sigma-70 family)
MQAGDRRAFDSLFQSEYPWSYRIASRAVANPDDAQDLVTEAWQKVWEQSDRLRDPGSFRPWASTIITNTINGHLRTRLRQKSVAEAVSLPEADEETLLSPDLMPRDPVGDEVLDRWAQEENRKAVAEACARLEKGLLELGRRLSPARAEVYQALLRRLSQDDASEVRTLRARIADDLRISRNTASMRLLWLFRKAAERGLPLETIVADPEMVHVARPIFQRVAASGQVGASRAGEQ